MQLSLKNAKAQFMYLFFNPCNPNHTPHIFTEPPPLICGLKYVSVRHCDENTPNYIIIKARFLSRQGLCIECLTSQLRGLPCPPPRP
jgi:hypothetical protein